LFLRPPVFELPNACPEGTLSPRKRADQCGCSRATAGIRQFESAQQLQSFENPVFSRDFSFLSLEVGPHPFSRFFSEGMRSVLWQKD